jgi:uncharacterized SAM-dependent methyltransferase
MKIDVVLTEAEIVQEFSEAVEARDLPEKFFYWSPFSVRAWLALAGDPAFESLRRTWQQLAAHAGGLLAPFGPSVPVISFGAGDGATDRLLLDAIGQARREPKYFPVDASQMLLEMACAGAEDLDIESSGIKADISSPMHLVFASDAAESPRLLLMSGNTLGGFDPLDQIRYLAQVLHPNDRLVIDAEMHSNGAPAYAEALLRQFAFAPLAGLGLSSEDGEVRFDHQHDERLAGLYMTTAHFRPSRDLRLDLSAKEVLVERGEHILLNLRYSFTPPAFRSVLQQAGLHVLDEISSKDARHLLAVCSRA